ncbi:MAG: hypothetical protein FJ286_03980 [Planctomycetes bacterium]|nr:hypothetical protein [Planctomycetota bacterium]
MRPPPATVPWLLPLLVIAAGGCAIVGETSPRIDTVDADDPRLTSAAKPAQRTVPVEVLFLRCAADDPLLHDDIWTHVDEQAVDAERRRALNANGLRVGVVSGRLPPAFVERLATSADAADMVGGDAPGARRRLQLLPGRGSELVTAARLPSLVILEQRDGSVRGGTYHDATTQLALDAHPAADGRVRLEMVPEIRHGPVEKSWAGEDGMFRLETGQRRHRLDYLGVEVTLPLDGMLLIGPAGAPSSSVGDGLLRDQGEGNTVRLLVIRPLGRSLDPVFAGSEPVDSEIALPVAPSITD